jgi:hypothetical protein
MTDERNVMDEVELKQAMNQVQQINGQLRRENERLQERRRQLEAYGSKHLRGYDLLVNQTLFRVARRFLGSVRSLKWRG